jgi:hypothetical protein
VRLGDVCRLRPGFLVAGEELTMPTYVNPDQQTLDKVATVLEQYHGELHAADVQVRVLMARGKRDKNGDTVGDAIRVRGCRAAGAIKITSEKDRAAGLADAVMLLDGLEPWEDMP